MHAYCTHILHSLPEAAGMRCVGQAGEVICGGAVGDETPCVMLLSPYPMKDQSRTRCAPALPGPTGQSIADPDPYRVVIICTRT